MPPRTCDGHGTRETAADYEADFPDSAAVCREVLDAVGCAWRNTGLSEVVTPGLRAEQCPELREVVTPAVALVIPLGLHESLLFELRAVNAVGLCEENAPELRAVISVGLREEYPSLRVRAVGRTRTEGTGPPGPLQSGGRGPVRPTRRSGSGGCPPANTVVFHS